MTRPWKDYVPRLPAALLIPAFFGCWFWSGLRLGRTEWFFKWEYPIPSILIRYPKSGWTLHYDVAFLVDTSISLAAGYVAAMVLDRLVFPFIRRRRGQKPATPPEPS